MIMADELGKKMYREKFNEMTICDKCSNYIGLTDVEGHYSGVCKECKEKGDTTEKFDGRVNRRSGHWSRESSVFD
tara:strand:+ start:594 stop:818 length:225 start_codon:yes stop_codon:yes gene_type:complete